MLFCTVPFTAIADTTNVIEDSALLAYLIDEGYDLDENGAISATEAADIMFIDARELGISSLEGLQYATSMFWIDVSKNNITDISPLANLELFIIDLSYNNLSGTIDFAQLNWVLADNITLSHNNIESVLNADTLSFAMFLDLSYNKLSDAAELLGFSSLETLLVNNNCYSLNPADADLGYFAQIESENAGMIEFVYAPQLVGEITEDFILDITDANLLDALIEKGVDITGDGKISACELGNVYTKLDLSNCGISDISALAYAVNVPALDLSLNEIESVDALAGFVKLKELDISYNKISDISALSASTALTSLDAAGNSIEDISVVAGFTALVNLDLSCNNISDASALEGLANLKTLSLSDNFISSVSFASSFETLDLSYNVFTTVADLVSIKAEKLDITYNNLVASNISASDFSSVTTLVYETQTEYDGSYRDAVEIPDAVLLEILLNEAPINTNGDNIITKGELAGATSLNLSKTGVTDITGLRYMKNVRTLRLDNTAVADISEVSGMVRLEILTAANSNISTLAPLSEIETLRVITVPNTKVSDISALETNKLYSLSSINLKGNGITDASALKNIPTLKTVTLSENKITSIDFVSSFTAPENLYFNGNEIENVDVVYGLSTLVELDVSSNCIDIPADFKTAMFANNENLVLLKYDDQKIKTYARIIIDVTGSNFFNLVIDGYDYELPQEEYTNSEVPIGSRFKVTAVPDAGEFLYWKNDNGKIVSYDKEYSFIVASAVHLTAVYSQSYANRGYVTFLTAFDQEISRRLYSATASPDKIEIPLNPEVNDYVFQGWSIDGKTVIEEENLGAEIVAALQNGNVTLVPIYTQADVTYKVTVINGTGSGEYAANINIAITANPAAEGMKFAYWIDETGKTISYEETYVFLVTSDTTLEAIYVNDDEYVGSGVLVAVSDITNDPEANAIHFVVTREVPEEYTVVQNGILLTKDGTLGTNEDAFVIGAEGVIKGTAAYNTNSGTYIATKGNVQAGDTWYARGYLVYLDTNGELVYIYSAIESITA